MCENPEKSYHPMMHEHWNEYVKEIREQMLGSDRVSRMVVLFLNEHPKYCFRSITSLAKDCDCHKDEIEQVVQVLWEKNLVAKHTRNEDQFGLVERLKKESSPEMWHQKDQFDLGQSNQDYYNNPHIDPDTFQPVFHDPAIFQPVLHTRIEKATQPDMFDTMQDCLREVQKLISQAEKLNQQVITSFS